MRPCSERHPALGVSLMELSIIFVNWNSLDYLRESITSVYEYTHDVPFEIIVVDNASLEGGMESLKQQFPDVRIIVSSKNLGFSAGNNLGYKHSSGAYLLFLNPDTRLNSPAINILLRHLKSLPDAGVVGCKLLNTDLSVQTSCIQTFPTILNQIMDVEWLRLRWPQFCLWGIGPLFSTNEKPTAVEMISGACMMLKRDVFIQAELFPEDYFMYADDLELCYKVRRIGFSNYYVGEATVIHHGGKSTSQKVNQWATVMKFRAIHKFLVKTRGWTYGMAYRVAMVGSAIARLMILGLMTPAKKCREEREMLRSASVKWIAILKWALGIDETVVPRG